MEDKLRQIIDDTFVGGRIVGKEAVSPQEWKRNVVDAVEAIQSLINSAVREAKREVAIEASEELANLQREGAETKYWSPDFLNGYASAMDDLQKIVADQLKDKPNVE